MFDVLYDKDGIKFEAEYNLESIFIHCSIDPNLKYNKTLYLKLLNIISYIHYNLKENNVKEVFSLVPTEDAKVYKFQLICGMTPMVQFNDCTMFRMVL